MTLTVPKEVKRWLSEVTDHTIRLRAVNYHHAGSQPGTLLPTLVDHEKFPATELLEICHKRWELELAFDEIKSHLLESKEALRSQSVDGTLQDFWTTLLLYNLIRREMHLVAKKEGATADRISFTGAGSEIQLFFMLAQNSVPGVLPRELAQLDFSPGTMLILPARRKDRRNPRHAKIKMSNYPKKPPRASSDVALAVA